MLSLASTVYQKVGRSFSFTHSATKVVFPNPAGAITNVAPGALLSKRSKRCFRDKKLAERAGGCERGRLTPEEVMFSGLIRQG